MAPGKVGNDSGLGIFVTLNKYLQSRGKSKREQGPSADGPLILK